MVEGLNVRRRIRRGSQPVAGGGFEVLDEGRKLIEGGLLWWLYEKTIVEERK